MFTLVGSRVKAERQGQSTEQHSNATAPLRLFFEDLITPVFVTDKHIYYK
jgi:hypothetical protein